MNTNDLRTAESTLLARIALTVAAERSCRCCGITVTGFDADFVRLGLCGTCRGLAESSLGVSGVDMLDRVHLVKHCPARARGK